MVPSKFLCPSDPILARGLERTEKNVELGKEVRKVRGAVTWNNRERSGSHQS